MDTSNWAVENGITTATFHILTPYPGTKLFYDMEISGKIKDYNWSNYDTRHLIFEHKNLSKNQMEHGYKKAYEEFYKWNNIIKGSVQHEKLRQKQKHLIYSGAWKKFESVWNFVVKNQLFEGARKLLETTLK